MAKIDITQVTSPDLKSGKYKDDFSEYYQLANYVENSLGHDHQPVLDHVIAVYAGLEEVIKATDLTVLEKNNLTNYLSEKIDSHTKLDLLKVATLLHDIAKNDTLMSNGDTAFCPGHELIGAARVKNFAERFNLSSREEDVVERLVRYHGLTWQLADLAIFHKNNEKYLKILKETTDEISLELILMMHADALGADLDKGDKKAFDERINWLVWMKKQLINN